MADSEAPKRRLRQPRTRKGRLPSNPDDIPDGDAADAADNGEYDGMAGGDVEKDTVALIEEDIKRLSKVVGSPTRLFCKKPPSRQLEKEFLPIVDLTLLRNCFNCYGPQWPDWQLIRDCLIVNTVIPLLKLWQIECLDDPAMAEAMKAAFMPNGKVSAKHMFLTAVHAWKYDVREAALDIEPLDAHSGICGIVARYAAKIYKCCPLINSVDWNQHNERQEVDFEAWRGHEVAVNVIILAYADLSLYPLESFFTTVLKSKLAAPMPRKIWAMWAEIYRANNANTNISNLRRSRVAFPCIVETEEEQESFTLHDANGQPLPEHVCRAEDFVQVADDSLVPFTEREHLAVLVSYKDLKRDQAKAKIDGEPTGADWAIIAEVIPGRTGAECSRFFRERYAGLFAVTAPAELQPFRQQPGQKRPMHTSPGAEVSDDESHRGRKRVRIEGQRTRSIRDSSSPEVPLSQVRGMLVAKELADFSGEQEPDSEEDVQVLGARTKGTTGDGADDDPISISSNDSSNEEDENTADERLVGLPGTEHGPQPARSLDDAESEAETDEYNYDSYELDMPGDASNPRIVQLKGDAEVWRENTRLWKQYADDRLLTHTTREIDRLRTQRDDAHGHIDDLELEVDKKDTALKKKDTALKAFQKRVTELEAAGPSDGLYDMVADQKVEIQSLKTAAGVRVDYSAHQLLLEKLSEAEARVDNQHTELEEIKAAHGEMIAEHENLKASYDQLKTANDQQETRRSEIEAAHAQTQADHDRMKNAHDQLKNMNGQQRTEYAQQIEQIQKAAADKETAHAQQIEQLQKSVTEKDEQLRKQIEKSVEMKDFMNANDKSAMETVLKLQKTVRELKAEVQALKKSESYSAGQRDVAEEENDRWRREDEERNRPAEVQYTGSLDGYYGVHQPRQPSALDLMLAETGRTYEDIMGRGRWRR